MLDINRLFKYQHARVSAPAARCDRCTVAHLDASQDSASGLGFRGLSEGYLK